MHWPFLGWHLYAIDAPTDLTFYEVRLSDGNGGEIKYNARAAPPSLTTPIRRLATNMVLQFSEIQRQECADFLFKKGVEYRDKVEQNLHRPFYLKFPLHQFGFRWSQENLEGIENFKFLRIYRIQALFSENGRVLKKKDQYLELEYSY